MTRVFGFWRGPLLLRIRLTLVLAQPFMLPDGRLSEWNGNVGREVDTPTWGLELKAADQAREPDE